MNINKNKKNTVFTCGPGEILNIDVFIGIVLIFSVNPKTVNITNLSSYINGDTIAVDGGVNLETISKVYETGIDVTIVGSGLFNADNISQRYRDLLDA